MAQEVVEGQVRALLAGAALPLGETTAVILLKEGAGLAARRKGVTVRTLHRWFARNGLTLRKFIRRARIRSALALIAHGKRTNVAAAAIGMGSASAFGRFVRREAGLGIGVLRRSPMLRKRRQEEEQCPRR